MSNPIFQSVSRFLDRHGLIARSRQARFCLVLAIVVDVWTLAGVHRFGPTYSLIALVLLGALLVPDWIGGEEQPDDMTIVLARAR